MRGWALWICAGKSEPSRHSQSVSHHGGSSVVILSWILNSPLPNEIRSWLIGARLFTDGSKTIASHRSIAVPQESIGGKQLVNNQTYQLSQFLKDQTTNAYSNLLTIRPVKAINLIWVRQQTKMSEIAPKMRETCRRKVTYKQKHNTSTIFYCVFIVFPGGFLRFF